jgi:hypothetical protein
MEARNNEEFHDLIDELTERKFFGEVTFYFQGGNIESSRKSERNTKNEVKEMMKSRKTHRILVPHPATAAAGGKA